MKNIEVELRRVTFGGSIRVVVDGGRPTFLTEQEVRHRLCGEPRLDAERLDDVVRKLTKVDVEHLLRYGNPTPRHRSEIRQMWAGMDQPAEQSV